MDLKLVIRALEIAFPMINRSLKWMREHVKKYNIFVQRNIVKIYIECDDNINAERVKKTLNDIMEAILS